MSIMTNCVTTAVKHGVILPCRSHTLSTLIMFHFVYFSPHLTWRDMQHIVVQTARPANLQTNDWVTNGVGRRGISTVLMI